jgi:hypothetical protein
MTRTHAYTHVTTHGRELGRAEALLSVGHQAFNLAARASQAASQPPEAGSRRPMSPSANHAPLEIIRHTLNSLTARLKHELTARIEHEPAFMHPNPNTQSLNPKSLLLPVYLATLPCNCLLSRQCLHCHHPHHRRSSSLLRAYLCRL